MKIKATYLIIPFIITSCGPSICDCIKAEKKDDGSYKNHELEEKCNELLDNQKEKLLHLSPEEIEEEIKEFEESINSCQ